MRRRSSGRVFVARHLDFHELTSTHFPGRTWHDLLLREQAKIIHNELVSDKILFDPESKCVTYWDVVVILALGFTSSVTPFEIALLETKLDALFVMNRLVDSVFLADMVLQFFIKIEVETPRGMTYLIRRRDIAKHYMKGWFFLDLLSLIPFELIGQIMNSRGVSRMKTLRLIRLCRLIKLARMLRASRIIKRWEGVFIFNYAYLNIFKIFCAVLQVSHWYACLYALIGLAYAEPICEGMRVVSYGGVSWVSETFGNGELDSPCNVYHVYMTALYWSAATITSIGYGDVVPINHNEVVMVIVCMLIGGALWAYLIGNACGMVANLDPFQKLADARMDDLNYMLRDRKVEDGFASSLRSYFRASQYLMRLEGYKDLRNVMSPQLRGDLVRLTSGNALNQVWWLKGADPHFLTSLSDLLEPQMFNQREVISVRNSLFFIEKGIASRKGRLLLRGSSWGDDVILETKLQDESLVTALTYLAVLRLTKNAIQEVTEHFPTVANAIQSHTNSFAARRRFVAAVRLVEQAIKKKTDDKRALRLVEKAMKKKEDNSMALPLDKEESRSSTLGIVYEPEAAEDRVNGVKDAGQILSQLSAVCAQAAKHAARHAATPTLPNVAQEPTKMTQLELKLDKLIQAQRSTSKRVEDLERHAQTIHPLLMATRNGAQTPSVPLKASSCGFGLQSAVPCGKVCQAPTQPLGSLSTV